MPDDRAAVDERRLFLLVLRCQAGDDAAFARLMETFGARTLGHLRGMLGDDADDVQQEVWLTVYRRIGALTNPRAFRTWLFQTTRHRAIDFLRARQRERELVDEVSTGTEPTVPPDEGLGRLDRSTLAGALGGLSPAQREVLLLRYQEDMSYAEIGVVMGCSIGTVRSRLHQARRRVQESIAGRP
jgi:RNA polymerase sigma-70 factor (ECF subfamily)